MVSSLNKYESNAEGNPEMGLIHLFEGIREIREVDVNQTFELNLEDELSNPKEEGGSHS